MAVLDRRHQAESQEFEKEWVERLEKQISEALKNAEENKNPESIKNRVENDLKLDKAAAMLKMKERHYEEKLELLTECAPAAAKNVQKGN